MSKKVLVSGIQSSGKLHIGNYFGAIKQNIELSNRDDFESYIFIADYHSMTTLTNKEERIENIYDIASTYLACGLDINKVTLFKQSDIPVHTELAWILETLTPMPVLELAHAYKDYKAKSKDVNAGVFNYPVLMASDILMYNANIVPVGKDQEQHIEITRELAGKFNRVYKKDFFVMPESYIKKEVALVPGIDGTKMSKSKNNHIPIFDTDEEILKRVMSIKTDSLKPEDKKNPDDQIIYAIHKLFLNEEEDNILRKKFEDGGYSYKEAKENCAKDIIKYFSPMREKYFYYMNNRNEIKDILTKGKIKAEEKAKNVMEEVRNIVGLSI